MATITTTVYIDHMKMILSPKEMKTLERDAQRRSFSFVTCMADGRKVKRTAFYFGGWNHLGSELCNQFPEATYLKGKRV